MKRRLVIIACALVLVFVVVRFGKRPVVSWYADHFIPRITPAPATDHPDEICLTWNGDPRTSQAIQWRTAQDVPDGWVEYRGTAKGSGAVSDVAATSCLMVDRGVKNDPVNKRFRATLEGLRPATTYTYRVGSKDRKVWSDWADFTTAPSGPAAFSFIELGDVHVGRKPWDKLVHGAFKAYPEAAFWVIAGDLVDKGSYRDQWDTLFASCKGIFNRKPLVPALGNHEYEGDPALKNYLRLFALPQNGPKTIPPGRAYSLRYGNALFVVLDSNLAPKDQAPWLESQLAHTDATWKIAVYHHPAYSSKPHRDNPKIREFWTPLFDKYHLDIAFEGHDHAYQRTYPLRGGKREKSASEGTYYIITVSGSNHYKQEKHDYAEVAFPYVSTYQVITITTKPNELKYAAYDRQGKMRDHFTITKEMSN